MRRIAFFLFVLVLLAIIPVYAGECVGESEMIGNGASAPFFGAGKLERFSIFPPQKITEVGIGWAYTCIDYDDSSCPYPDSSSTHIDYEIVIYKNDGTDGGPGTLLARIQTSAENIPNRNDDPYASVLNKTDISNHNVVATTGEVYVGLLYTNNGNNTLYWITDSNFSYTSLGTYYSNRHQDPVWIPWDMVGYSREDFCAVFEPALPVVDPPGATSGDECSGLDPNKPTVVLTHGLQDTDVDPLTDLWTGFEPLQAGALITEQFGSSVNICKWVWEGAFQEHFQNIPTADAYIAANANTVNAGRALSNKLLSELGANYSQPIHFIGHSLGVPVNAYATVFFLNGAPFEETIQFTALDRPHHISKILGIGSAEENLLGYGSRFLRETLVELARPVNVLLVDNFYSLTGFSVGDRALGPIYNHQPLVSPGVLNQLVFSETLFSNDHSGVHQWYRWTIDPTLRSPSYPDIEPCVGGTFNPLFITEVGLDASLSPCGVGWQWSLNAEPSLFPQVQAPVFTPHVNTQVSVQEFVVFGCTVNSQSTPPTLSCVEPTQLQGDSTQLSSVIGLSLPPLTSRIQFEYRFTGASDGDYAVISLDGHPIWSVSGVDTIGEFVDSGFISVGHISGAHFMWVTLYGVGEPNTEFEIRNIEFISEEVLFADGFESGDLSMWSQ